MNDNSFQVYLNSTLMLIQTLVVKSEYTANRINERLTDLQSYPVTEDPRTWKYYMNLAGEYHPTDAMMQVISSDNRQLIDFTIENLNRHPNTRRDYQFGSRQYSELLEQYPNQEDVILGVLYPVNKEAAIAAPDHKILGYPVGLIEPNEYTLVEELQQWTELYFKRYYNNQYTITDSLYYGVVLSMYYMNLLPAILTCRLRRHKTVEAHSFYVKQYLASHSSMGEYHPFMTLKQAHHFYRNIRYYQRHPGSNENFMKLIDALMTERQIPIAKFSMRHDTTDMEEEIYPKVMFKKTDLTRIPTAGTPEYINTPTFLAKEIPEAFENEQEIAFTGSMIDQELKDTPANVVQTKLLESAMIDYSSAFTYSLESVQVAHWLQFAATGLYASIINVANPLTAERIIIDAKEAYVLAIYCMLKSYNFEPNEIPLLAAERVLRYPLPSDDDLRSVVDMRYINDFTWDTFKDSIVRVEEMISIDAFYETTTRIHRKANFQRDLVAYQEGMHHRSQTFMLVSRLYGDEYHYLAPKGTTFGEWLSARSLDFGRLNAEEFAHLYASIIKAVLGKELNTTPSMRNVQKAMARALKSLSSYSIQISTQIADDETIMTDLPSLRVGDQNVDAEHLTKLPLGYTEIFSQKLDGENHVELAFTSFDSILSRHADGETSHYLDLQNGPFASSRGLVLENKFNISRVEFSVVNKPDTTGTRLPPILGMGDYMLLTEEQKRSLFE